MLPLIYLDEALLAISKPAGLPALPDGYDKSAPYVRALLETDYGRLWIVHRLDKETSGVMILPRTADAHRGLNRQFDVHSVIKVYHALVVGSPPWEQITLDAALRINGDRRHRTIPHSDGKAALTHVQVLQRGTDYTLIEARPATGRTHQIRAHLGFVAGFPLVGDPLYGCKIPPDEWPIGRVALHACSVTCVHPISGEPLTISAPYSEDFSVALTKLT